MSKTQRMTGTRISALGLGLALALAGCDNIHNAAVGGAGGESVTPFADVQTLERLAAEEGVVNWKVARFFALEKLASFSADSGWEGATLSETPLLIYRNTNGKPRYYEFRVLRDGAELGAITCVVETAEGDPVQYVLPYAKTVSEENSRAVSSSAGRLVDTGYPGKLLVKDSSGARSVEADTGLEVDTSEYFDDVKVREWLESADPEMLAGFGITTEELYDYYLAKAREQEAEVAAFWAKVAEAQNEILALSEEEILDAFAPEDEEAARATKLGGAEFVLGNWNSKVSWFNPRGWCGPNVMTFITLGLGANAGSSVYVPTSNNSTSILALYYAFEREIGTNARLYSDLNRGLRNLTSYKVVEEPWLSHNWSKTDTNIKRYALPAISLRMGKSLFDQWHYRAIIGTKWETWRTKKSFLWWSWNEDTTYNWYLIHDNGTDYATNQAWWESSGQLYHLQTAHVEHKQRQSGFLFETRTSTFGGLL